MLQSIGVLDERISRNRISRFSKCSCSNLGGGSAHAALLGDSVRAQLSVTGSATVFDQTTTVLDPGIEFTFTESNVADVSLDLREDAFDIIYSINPSISSILPLTWTLSDLDWVGSPSTVVTGLSLVSGDASLIAGTSFTDDSVSVSLARIANPPAVHSFSFDIQTAEAIPTPALLPGLIGFGMSIARKRKQAEAQA